MIEVGTKEGKVIHTIILNEPEDEVIGVAECITCGLRVALHGKDATEIAKEVQVFIKGHPCVQGN